MPINPVVLSSIKTMMKGFGVKPEYIRHVDLLTRVKLEKPRAATCIDTQLVEAGLMVEGMVTIAVDGHLDTGEGLTIIIQTDDSKALPVELLEFLGVKLG